MISGLKFNKCKSDDLETIKELALMIWPETYKEILSKEQMEYMLEMMYSLNNLNDQFENGHLFYIVKEEEREIAFVGLQPNYPEEGTLRIHKIYLLPSYQGKKIGRWMIDQVELIARNSGMSNLHLNVNRFNTAIPFYERVGFTKIKEEDIHIGNGFYMNDFVMIKEMTNH